MRNGVPPQGESEQKAQRVSRAADSVDRVYGEIKALAVEYRFRPGQKVNEVELADRMGVSRTPVREALNRLVRDGFMTFVPNKGFYAREISPDTVRDLYELRAAIEHSAFRLACQRGSDAEIEAAARIWEKAVTRKRAGLLQDMSEADEAFHLAIARLSQNVQIVDALERLNARIRFFRRTDMETTMRRTETFGEHERIIDHLRRRDPAGADILQQHVSLSSAHAIIVTKEVIARIFLGPSA
ncbi:MAG: GntR family transcriptional regulator [Alphaproteobacteria bacterium]|nr:GntR family transcriptional regulator [Alphaproteobacteria bacterium]MBU0797740.1 GntR family transcriptional regulator [Alphaproteobacteria bacterium]MBU0887099.1 GntR family transcriptional regulator [Alphaproteobacteria bacterium]MBU1814349.1 GntR family transcriptional regulator [Alphaproteobacteria bacterium]